MSDQPRGELGAEIRQKEPIACAYDDTDGELIAVLYSWEVVAELEDVWFIRIEELNDAE